MRRTRTRRGRRLRVPGRSPGGRMPECPEVKALVTGATGFVGGRLAQRLAADGVEVRCLVRDTRPGRATSPRRATSCTRATSPIRRRCAVPARASTSPTTSSTAWARGSSGDFEAARATRGHGVRARWPAREGVERVVYLGGLGDDPGSKHLRSRHATAVALADDGPAADVLPGGDGRRRRQRVLPDAPLPGRAAAGDDRARVAEDAHPADRDRRRARVPRRPRRAWTPRRGARSRSAGPTSSPTATCSTGWPRRSAPTGDRSSRSRLLTPWLSSLWIGLVTPVDAGVARPLVEGLSTETVVTDPSGAALFDVKPTPVRRRPARGDRGGRAMSRLVRRAAD